MLTRRSKEVFRKMAITLDISPDLALPRLVLQPIHRPAHKRLVPYVCVRQNDLPSLLVPRFEAPDLSVAPFLGDDPDERVYRVLFAPRGDPRPLARMWIDLARANETERRRLVGATIDDAATPSIAVDIVRLRTRSVLG